MISGKKLILVFLCIAVLVLLGILFFAFNKKGQENLFPTPTLVESNVNGPDAVPGLDTTINQAGRDKQNQSAAVYSLVERLPYSGKYFTLYYSFSKDLFVLYINPSFKSQGDTEFEEFLKTNSIQRGWFKNLFTTYLTPTPTPQKTIISTPAP